MGLLIDVPFEEHTNNTNNNIKSSMDPNNSTHNDIDNDITNTATTTSSSCNHRSPIEWIHTCSIGRLA